MYPNTNVKVYYVYSFGVGLLFGLGPGATVFKQNPLHANQPY